MGDTIVPRVLTITADWYHHPQTTHKGKYLYMYSDNDRTTYKYRFLGFCVNQYAVRIAEIRRSNFAGATAPTPTKDWRSKR